MTKEKLGRVALWLFAILSFTTSYYVVIRRCEPDAAITSTLASMNAAQNKLATSIDLLIQERNRMQQELVRTNAKIDRLGLAQVDDVVVNEKIKKLGSELPTKLKFLTDQADSSRDVLVETIALMSEVNKRLAALEKATGVKPPPPTGPPPK